MILYHGGSAIVENPDCAHSRKAVDFGPGFYVTSIYEQARSWAQRRLLRSGHASISRYDFDESSQKELKVLRFDSYSKDWLDFIVACRSESDTTDYDLVIGGVANDKVFDTLEAFFDGFATKEQTIDKLRFESPNVQYCFRTEKALSTLRFLGGDAL